jgi:ribonuclease T1
MRCAQRITLILGAAMLLAALLVGGTTATAHAQVGNVCYGALPSQAHHTLSLIASGGPFPYPQDGTTFYNREGLLPSQSTGYYREYTVETPGSPTRGARRIVTGDSYREDYYTADHYASFRLIDYRC